MIGIRTFLIAAAVAVAAAGNLPAPAAAAGICDKQQGKRVLIGGVWHKVVHNKRGGLVDCGPGNAF